MASKSNLTDNQRIIQKTMDITTDVVIAYAAPTVPPLGNLTKEGLLEEFGRLNEARKAVEKTEKIVRGRLESMLDGAKELRGDNFTYKKDSNETTRLNQTKAKALLEAAGYEPSEYMDTSEQDRVTVKRN